MRISRNIRPSYRQDIDGLRGIAVLAVIAFHAFPKQVPGGFVGVDIFFVISGFLISSIIFKSLEQESFSFAEFYCRRIRRIFPALMIVLMASLAFGWIALLPDEYRQLAGHTAAGAGFISNLILWRESGYFDNAASLKPLLHLWSLGIEEQFYLVWPVTLVLLWKRRCGVQWSIACLTVLSFSVNIFLAAAHPNADFYLPFSRFWELLLGSILAYNTLFGDVSIASMIERVSVPPHVKEKLRNAISVLGALFIALAVILFSQYSTSSGWWGLLPTFGAVLLILAGPEAWINRTVLRNRGLVFVGLISYPLYLWHWPLLSFSEILTTPTIGLKLGLIVASFLLAWGTWKYFEGSLRERADRIGPRADILSLSVGLAFVWLLGATLYASNGVPGRLPAGTRAFAKDVAFPEFDPSELANCPVQLKGLDICAQSKQGAADAALVGDSHARSLFFGLAASDQQRSWLVVGHSGCPPTLGIRVNIGEGEPARCAEQMKQSLNYLTGPEGPNVIVFSFFGYYAQTAVHLQENHPEKESKEDVLYRGLARAIEPFIAERKRVFLMVDIPDLPFLPRDCIRRFLFTSERNCSLERQAVDLQQRGLRQIVNRLQGRFPDLIVFDPLPLLCNNLACNPVGESFSFYQDTNHLNVKGSEVVANSLIALIDKTEHGSLLASTFR